jgi:hypothetical protein
MVDTWLTQGLASFHTGNKVHSPQVLEDYVPTRPATCVILFLKNILQKNSFFDGRSKAVCCSINKSLSKNLRLSLVFIKQ